MQTQILELNNAGTLQPLQNSAPNPDRASIYLVPFISPFDRPDLPSEPKSYRARNQDFYLRVYMPPGQIGAPYENFYLLHNGLGESLPNIYDEMCLDLAQRKKMPVIFLPLPLHFCRHHEFRAKEHDPYEALHKDVSIITSQRIFQGVAATPERLINSYKQTLEETKAILHDITTGHDPFWKNVFSPKSRFSLFGYSFGGFSALAYLLLEREPKKVEKVFLFESGGFIDQIDASVLFHRRDSVARALWRYYYVEKRQQQESEPLFSRRDSERVAREDFEAALQERGDHPSIALKTDEYDKLFRGRPSSLSRKGKEGFVYSEPYRVFSRSDIEARELWRDVMATLYQAVDADQNLSKMEAQIFRQIYLGHERVAYRRKLEKVQDKILVISGGADEIFPTRNLLDLGPDTGLALLQVPGITHWVKTRSEDRWRQWQRMVVDVMETFRQGSNDELDRNSLSE